MVQSKPITYAQFKTGLTFTDVRRMLWSGDSEDRTTWRQKGRGSVLGYWRELKRQMWEQFKAQNPDMAIE